MNGRLARNAGPCVYSAGKNTFNSLFKSKKHTPAPVRAIRPKPGCAFLYHAAVHGPSAPADLTFRPECRIIEWKL